MKKVLAFLIAIVVFTFLLIGCSAKYRISYETNGGTKIKNTSVQVDESFVLPTNPEKEGFVFVAWYVDSELTTQFDSDEPLVEDKILYAKWNPILRRVYLQDEDTVLTGFYIKYGETINLSAINIDGYNFLGWYQESTFETNVETVTGTLEDQIIYGKFEDVPYEVPVEGTIDLTALPYFSYFSPTNPVVTITVKGIGVMTLELFPSVAQNTVNNFIQYIQLDFYTNSSFHRVIENFVIQGGTVENTFCPISGEFESNGFTNDLVHSRGVLSMARTKVMDSATSQFFIVHKTYPNLDSNYATFGGLTSGFNVLDFIASITTGTNDNPLKEIVIESITIELNGYVPGIPVCTE